MVHSRAEGAWGGVAALVPEVAIGELDGPEEYLFGNVASIAVDDDKTVYVLDAQAQEVRVFDAAGTHVETLGGRGEGPGELKQGEAIAVLPDGRLLVRDPANMRVQVFGPGPGETDEWRYNSGNHFTDRPLYTDSRGHTYLFASDPLRDHTSIVVELAADGTPLDTFPAPTSDHEPAIVRAEVETSSSSSSRSMNVPFSPFFTWTVHPSGHFLTGLSTEYRIELARDDGVLRIERDYEPVPVSDTERDFTRRMIEGEMREVDPDWSWDGPPIPDYKPPFAALHAGRDGRIWVLLATAHSIVENEDHDPSDPRSQPVTFQIRGRYDVFESDGVYLGDRRGARRVLRLPAAGLRRRLRLGRRARRTRDRTGGAVPDRGGRRCGCVPGCCRGAGGADGNRDGDRGRGGHGDRRVRRPAVHQGVPGRVGWGRPPSGYRAMSAVSPWSRR